MNLLTRLETESGRELDCVMWPRTRDKTGRGRIWDNGRLKLAHRWVWENLCGPIPDGKLICHHCDNPWCVNIHHLYVGTHKDNSQDMARRKRQWTQKNPKRAGDVIRRWCRKGVHSQGEKNPRAKLSSDDANDIRLSGEKTKALAEKYCVHRTTIQRIRRGVNWRCIAALKARGVEGGT